jgi:hypothetical protein
MRAPSKILILSALLLLVQSYLSAQEKSAIKSGKTDSLRELEVASVSISFDDQGRLAGTFGAKLGTIGTEKLKNSFTQISKEQHLQNLQTGIRRSYRAGITISGLEIDSSESADRVQLRYNLDGEMFKEDIVYFNPMLAMRHFYNPVRSEKDPMEKTVSYPSDEMYVFSMDIPPGYEVSELPASGKVVMDNNDGVFEYQMTKSITTVNLRTSIRMARTTYAQEDFEALSKFFDEIIKKHGEQIVFKRKK